MRESGASRPWLVRWWWLVLLAIAILAYLIYFGYILPHRIFDGF